MWERLLQIRCNVITGERLNLILWYMRANRGGRGKMRRWINVLSENKSLHK